MATLTAGRSTIFSSPKLPTVGQSHGRMIQLQARPVGLCPRISLRLISSPVQGSSRMQSASVICASALDASARCGAEQTQTIIRKSPTITNVPGKEKSPRLDNYDGGPPPNKNNGGGDDDNGGDGGNWSGGGFGFFGFLLFLSFLKDIESEGSYRDNRRK